MTRPTYPLISIVLDELARSRSTDICMVFEVLGHNLLKTIVRSKYKGIHIDRVRCYMRQVGFVMVDPFTVKQVLNRNLHLLNSLSLNESFC